MPETNQRFRELAFHISSSADGRVYARLLRGPNELSLGELRTQRATYPFHQRLALSCAPLVLTLFVASLSRWRRRSALVFGLVALILYFPLLYSVHRPKEWPALAAWTPDLIMAVATLAVFVFARRSAGQSAAVSADQLLR